MTTYYAFNQIFGSIGRFDRLPGLLRLGLKQIGPSYNNRRPPIAFVTEDAKEFSQFLGSRGAKWKPKHLAELPLNEWTP